MRFDSFPVLGPNTSGQHDTTASVLTTASTAAIPLGSRTLNFLSVDSAFNIRRGASTIDAASASDLRLPAGGYLLDTGNSYTNIRIYNPNATTLNYWIASCSNT